jgi:hypothetical protein
MVGGDDSHSVFRQKLLGEDGSVRRGVVMVKLPGLFSPKFGATSLHVFTQSPQNLAVEPGIHSLVGWERYFALLAAPVRNILNTSSYIVIHATLSVVGLVSWLYKENLF